MLRRGVIGDLRNRLREVWLAKDDVAEWRICMLQLHAHSSTNFEDRRSRRLYPPSPDTPIELAIDWVRRNLSRRRVCRNPDCSRPYFVVSSARRCLCSDACIAATQKAHKRRWWKDKKGSQLYKQRSKQKSIERETMEPLAVSGRASMEVESHIPGGESERTLKRFLHNMVNALEDRFDHLLSAYPKFFPSQTRTERLAGQSTLHKELLPPKDLEIIKQREKREALEQLREGLQSIWNADNLYTAQWRLFTLQAELQSMDQKEWDPPPEERPIHQALGLLRRNAHMLRKCSNASCQTFPFFIAGRSSQTHCSTNCTTATQKEFKTRWWKEKGKQWRRSRRAKKKKSSKHTRQKR